MAAKVWMAIWRIQFNQSETAAWYASCPKANAGITQAGGESNCQRKKKQFSHWLSAHSHFAYPALHMPRYILSADKQSSQIIFAWIGVRPICFISDRELVDAHLITLALLYDCSCECIPRLMCVCVCLQVRVRARRWFPWRARQMGREWLCSLSLPPESHEGIQRRCPTLNPLTEIALFWFSRSAQHNRKVNLL